MSTRGTISAVMNDGSVVKVYSHYDGYIKGGVGEALFRHYNTLDEMGDLLQGEVRCIDYSDGGFEHFSDGGNEIFEDLDRYFEDCYFHDYNYLFKDGEWFVDGEKLKTYFIKELV